jgi:hypothetical protein
VNDLTKGFVARAPTTEDFRAVADLIRTSDLASFGEPDYLEEEFLAEWRDLDLQTDAWVVVTPGGELAGYAAIEPRGNTLYTPRVTCTRGTPVRASESPWSGSPKPGRGSAPLQRRRCPGARSRIGP